MLAKGKLNSVETLINVQLIIILKEKVKYERMKYILESEKHEKITKLY